MLIIQVAAIQVVLKEHRRQNDLLQWISCHCLLNIPSFVESSLPLWNQPFLCGTNHSSICVDPVQHLSGWV